MQERSEAVPATQQQMASLTKLCQHLGKPAPAEPLSYQAAKEQILSLSKEYNESRQSRKASAAPTPALETPPAPVQPPVAVMDRSEMIEMLAERIRGIGGLYERASAMSLAHMPENWKDKLAQEPDQRAFELQVATYQEALDTWQDKHQQVWRESGGLPIEWLEAYRYYSGTQVFGQAAVNAFKQRVLEDREECPLCGQKHAYTVCALKDMTNHMFDKVYTELAFYAEGLTRLENGVIVSPNYPHPKQKAA